MMPTGYTADIANGITFEQYALSCARAFGALILMRDDPADAPIPEKFKPASYHTDKIVEVTAELKRIQGMYPHDAEQSATDDYTEQVNAKIDSINKAAELRAKYVAMLDQVRAWIPPSPDHVEYKKFMETQIEQSIDFDCSTDYLEKRSIDRLSGEEWRSKRINELIKELVYHKREHINEVERTDGRNRWIKQLHDSLATRQGD